MTGGSRTGRFLPSRSFHGLRVGNRAILRFSRSADLVDAQLFDDLFLCQPARGQRQRDRSQRDRSQRLLAPSRAASEGTSPSPERAVRPFRNRTCATAFAYFLRTSTRSGLAFY
jgi:hypothetical protein